MIEGGGERLNFRRQEKGIVEADRIFSSRPCSGPVSDVN